VARFRDCRGGSSMGCDARSEVTNLPAYMDCPLDGFSPDSRTWLTMKTSTARFCSGTSPAVR
jgi:hypothetical protein